MLVLLDGTLSLIPASWTDLRSVQEVPGNATRARAAVLAEIGYLLQACTVVKPLLERIAAATPKAAAAPHNKRRVKRAATELSRTTRVQRRRSRVGFAR